MFTSVWVLYINNILEINFSPDLQYFVLFFEHKLSLLSNFLYCYRTHWGTLKFWYLLLLVSIVNVSYVLISDFVQQAVFKLYLQDGREYLWQCSNKQERDVWAMSVTASVRSLGFAVQVCFSVFTIHPSIAEQSSMFSVAYFCECLGVCVCLFVSQHDDSWTV